MKKVLIIAYTYPPDSRSGTFRILHFANEMAARGAYQPFILTVDPRYLEKGVDLDHRLVGKLDPRVTVIRTRCFQLRDFVLGLKASPGAPAGAGSPEPQGCAPPAARRRSLWQKVKDIVSEEVLAFPDRQVGWLPFAVVAGARTVRKEGIDVLLATGSPWTSFCVGALLKLVSRRPLVIDYRDPWTDNPFKGQGISRAFVDGSKCLENRIARFSDAIISNTDAFREILASKYPGKGSLHTVHNGYAQGDLDSFAAPEPEGDREHFVLTYTGALYGHRTIDNFMLAFKDLVTHADFGPSLKLQLVGGDHDTISVCQRIMGRELLERHCLVSGRISHEECLRYQMASHCLLVFQQGTVNQIPRKIFEYLAMQKPILAIVDGQGETSRVINESSSGLVVRDCPEAIATAVRELYRTYDEYLGSIRRGDFHKKYEVRELSRRMEAVLDCAIQAGGR